MGKSCLLIVALVGIVYCVNALPLEEKKPMEQQLPTLTPPNFAPIREKRGYGFEDEHEEDHEHGHSSHDEHYSSHDEHHKSDHLQKGENYGHHGLDLGHHDERYGHGNEEYELHGHHGHDGHDLHDKHHGIEFGYHHGVGEEHGHATGHHDFDLGHHGHHAGHVDHHDSDEDDEHHGHHDLHDEVDVHVGQFDHHKSSALKQKENTKFEKVKEVKYEVEKTKFNHQSQTDLAQHEQFGGFNFDGHAASSRRI